MTDASGIRCFGSYTYVGGLSASPKALAAMQPNELLDEDKITGYRTTFAGVRDNVALIVETSPHETTEVAYDRQTGRLVSIRNAFRMLPGTTQVTELQVAQRP